MGETTKEKRKKWLLIVGTILVIALVFTGLSWSSIHPKEEITLKEFETGVKDGSISEIDCVNGSYIALAEKEKGVAWVRISGNGDENLDETVEKIAQEGEIMLTRENTSLPAMFFIYVIQFSMCYGVVWLLWWFYGKVRIGKRKERYRRE